MRNEKLINVRNSKGLTQEEAADKMEIPLSTYKTYEYNTREPKVNMAIKIAKFYGVIVEDIFGDNVNK